MPCAASQALSPADSRHRHHRLARLASHGWLTGAKSIVAVLPAWRPRLRSRHLSRGYSTSQPLPKASCSMRARASRTNWRRRRPWCRAARTRPILLPSGPAASWLPSRPGPAGSAEPWQGAAAPGVRLRGTAARTGSPAAAGREGSAHRSAPARDRDRRARRRTRRPLPAGPPPAFVMSPAERRGPYRPPLAVRDQAGARRRCRGRVVQGQPPGADVGAPGAGPSLVVHAAQPAPGLTVVAAVHLAGRRRQVAGPLRAGGRREPGQVRLAGLKPALAVPPAHVPVPGGPLAAGHRARRPAEHRVSRVEGQHPGTELRPGAGDQLLQQAARSRGNARLLTGRAHRVCPSKTHAEIRILTSPRVPAA